MLPRLHGRRLASERGCVNPNRRARRVDANQVEVTEALRKIGAAVTPIHTLGKGIPDLLVSYRQRWIVLEVKDGKKPPSKRELTTDEKDWIGAQHAPVHIVTSAAEAVGILQMVT